VIRVAKDEHEREFLAIIERHGWHVMLVYGDDAGPNFAYSTGIYERIRQPELIVFGLAVDVSHFLVNDYAARIVKGESFEPGDRYKGFLDHADFTFLNVTDQSVRWKYTTWTSWYYDGAAYPLVQGIWPDKKTGAFPWERGYQPQLRDFQPLLASPPSLQ
jgi:Domain of unknown function (DUF4262)